MHSAHGHPLTLREQLADMTGVNSARCYQCAKCSAGCPMSSEMRLHPHDILRMVTQGQQDRLFNDESIWLCLTCETCSARCPNGCDPAALIDAVRELAAREAPDSQPRLIRAFHHAFLDQIRLWGRMFEVGLVADYKMRSFVLMQDVDTVPGLMVRGKLKVLPQTIDGVADVRRIFKACTRETGESS
jgi:heterodisulfide reductase subunit C